MSTITRPEVVLDVLEYWRQDKMVGWYYTSRDNPHIAMIRDIFLIEDGWTLQTVAQVDISPIP